MIGIGHVLSISDLLLIDNFKAAFGSDDKVVLEKILFDNGIDVEEPYTLEYSKHRNLRGNIVSCERFVGIERSDISWLKSGASSWENIVANCDLDLRIQLMNMGKNHSNTAHIVSELERHAN